MRVTSYVSGIIASSGQVAAVAQPAVVIPPSNTNVVPPPSSSGQPLGVQPVNNLASWGYAYPATQPPTINQVYQQPEPATIYPGIPYPRNYFVPWGKPNWSNVLSYGGSFVNTTGGFVGTP